MSYEVGMKIYEAFSNCKIYHVYGLTEASPRVAYLPPEYFKEYPNFVGYPLKSVSIDVLNKSGKICHEDEEGILYIKGDNIMIGYYGDSEKTQETIKDGWLCTGDIVYVNTLGFIRVRGRKDDLIIRAGMNIYPTEIEARLKKDPRVKEALVYGFDNQFGTQIGLKIVGDFESIHEVKKLCASALPSFQIPVDIEILDELPKNASGKVIRRGNYGRA